MKAYIGDTEDLKQDSSYQETWDSMIVNVSIINPKMLYRDLVSSLDISSFSNSYPSYQPWILKTSPWLVCFLVLVHNYQIYGTEYFN